jgi:hypothetical protein
LVLIDEVCSFTDFNHLTRLDGGEEKARIAEESVTVLRRLSQSYRDQIEDRDRSLQNRSAARERVRKQQGVSIEISRLNREFLELFVSKEPQARGFKLEKIMRELFAVYDLDPRASFKVRGEQIDGSFTFESTDYLFEAKWQKEKVPAADLDAFSAKVGRKLENTLGLFLSLNGFTTDGIQAHSRGSLRLLLMDGPDLIAVLEDRIELPQLLKRKRRHASETGEIFISASTFL